VLEGALQRMNVRHGDPACYELVLQSDAAPGEDPKTVPTLPLNPLVGKGLRLEFNGRITCSECGSVTRKSYGEGYCYPCFRRLARCDLCVVSPVRCHYAAGTCREPEWGEAFCMQPHLVYLANSSGPKVGITTQGGQLGRWLDQGASQGLVVASASSRHLAGVLEDRLSRRVSDRTDWRALLRSDAAPVDLVALRQSLRPAPDDLPDGVRWLDDQDVVALTFPVLSYPRHLVRFALEREGTVGGRLLGIKGQYLLFEHGVLNIRRHRAYHVRVDVFEADDDTAILSATRPSRQFQMELFR
jgi:hypothetical protein